MKKRINRADYFLRDGQYFPILFNKVGDDSPVSGPLLRELSYYDNHDGENLPGGQFDIYGFPPELEKPQIQQAAWDEEVARNNFHGLKHHTSEVIPNLKVATAAKDEPKRENVSHYTTGQIETIEFIDDKFDGVEFCLANIVKYAVRAKHKGQLRSDLEKIRNYATIALELDAKKNGETE